MEADNGPTYAQGPRGSIPQLSRPLRFYRSLIKFFRHNRYMCGAVGSSNVHRSSTRLSERTNGGRLVQNVDLGFGPRRPNLTTLRKILRSGHGMIPFILLLKHALKLPLYYRVAGELLPPTACPTSLGRRNQSTSVSHVQVTFPPSYARESTLNAEYLLQSPSPRSLGSR